MNIDAVSGAGGRSKIQLKRINETSGTVGLEKTQEQGEDKKLAKKNKGAVNYLKSMPEKIRNFASKHPFLFVAICAVLGGLLAALAMSGLAAGIGPTLDAALIGTAAGAQGFALGASAVDDIDKQQRQNRENAAKEKAENDRKQKEEEDSQSTAGAESTQVQQVKLETTNESRKDAPPNTNNPASAG
ncbi:MAG: hypothetical protein OXC48_09850 [Endozoicomonadaceae bacterium]|nr:hypothetical protein [Endozoicomonadaceae bacterium]